MLANTVPWKHIFSSGAFWSLLFAHFGYSWGFHTMLVQMPTYMNNILEFNISDNGIFSAVPYMAMLLVGLLSSFLADILIKWKLMRQGPIRKFFQTFGQFCCGTCLLIITFLNYQTMTIYALLVLAVGLSGSAFAGYMINHVDLSPNFAGEFKSQPSKKTAEICIQTRENWSFNCKKSKQYAGQIAVLH